MIERPVPGPLPTLGKGQQTGSLPLQQYSDEGKPLTANGPDRSASDQLPDKILTSEAEIQQAIANARPGQVFEITPGTYTLNTRIRVRNAGLVAQPIVVRARSPGSVAIQFVADEGFYVTAPYWQFENLVIRGRCKDDSDCEHAFHIVGKARGTVIRNNRIEDFNAQIKVNSLDGDWPDDGLVQFNTLINTHARATLLPVAMANINTVNGWQIADNIVANFVKGIGNRISYGIFMKGAGSGGRIERNLVVCTLNEISQGGQRIGISFGGGNTAPHFCRDKACAYEHKNGVAANNIVAHCNDFGIDVNRSVGILVANNTLINTAGMDVRNPPASAIAYGNLLEGRLRARANTSLTREQNLVTRASKYYQSSDLLGLGWAKKPGAVPTHPAIRQDFCGQPRAVASLPGAGENLEQCRSASIAIAGIKADAATGRFLNDKR